MLCWFHWWVTGSLPSQHVLVIVIYHLGVNIVTGCTQTYDWSKQLQLKHASTLS